MKSIFNKKNVKNVKCKIMKLGITGDIHGEATFSKIFKAKKLGYTHIIICGDFSYIWDGSFKEQKRLNYLSEIGMQILFCDGNHENFDLLNAYPVTEMYGGKAHKIKENIIHLMRGEIYHINDKSFFVFGGAKTRDIIYYSQTGKKKHRIEGKDWWKEEIPSEEEMNYGLSNLNKNNNKIDYIITHTCYPKALLKLGGNDRLDSISAYLNSIKDTVDFRYWYFGHMHTDYDIKEMNTRCLHRNIIDLY